MTLSPPGAARQAANGAFSIKKKEKRAAFCDVKTKWG